ncbi:MAG: hypothetical protein HeimC3_37010 [Candidatus Heimdallarchaeota archaeon LC_3]|nr:MAG: hypothetical protein HeimC3_37010 [Candidatus Heimdallarchaeota archaeon LC_3]
MKIKWSDYYEANKNFIINAFYSNCSIDEIKKLLKRISCQFLHSVVLREKYSPSSLIELCYISKTKEVRKIRIYNIL